MALSKPVSKAAGIATGGIALAVVLAIAIGFALRQQGASSEQPVVEAETPARTLPRKGPVAAAPPPSVGNGVDVGPQARPEKGEGHDERWRQPQGAWSWRAAADFVADDPGGDWRKAYDQIMASRGDPDLTAFDRVVMMQRLLDRGDLPPEIGALIGFMLAENLRSSVSNDPGSFTSSGEIDKWYRHMLARHTDQTNQFIVMRAKTAYADFLGDSPTNRNRQRQALLTSVLDIPQNEIVFGAPELTYLNLDRIKGMNLDPPKDAVRFQPTENKINGLMRQRQSFVDGVRAAAAKELAYTQVMPGLGSVTRERLQRLKDTRPDDPVFRRAVQDVYDWYDRVNSRRQTPNWDSLEEDQVISSFK